MHSRKIQNIHQDTGVSIPRIEETLRLLDQGATVPFIARYRKQATGNLDARRIQAIRDRYHVYQRLEERAQWILSAIEKNGPVSAELRERILDCDDRQRLEDLYLPYRSRRPTKGTIARKKGLDGLASDIRHGRFSGSVGESALRFVDLQKGVPTVEAAIEGALDILSEELAEDSESRQWLRERMLSEGVVRTTVTADMANEKTKYSMYYDFTEPVARIPSHRMLAVRRATKQKILTFSIQIDHDRSLTEFKARLGVQEDSESGKLLARAAEDAYRRLMEPAIEGQVRSLLRSRAEDEAIEVFQENLYALLGAAPAGRIPLIGVDPGIQKGADIAAVNSQGGLLEHHTIYLAGPQQDLASAESILMGMINAHTIRGIVIGGGRGVKETEDFVRSFLQKYGLEVFSVVQTESTTSVAAAKHVRREFPGLESGHRRAISAARRLQDPLSELVGVDPRAIGVGQYQHDVDQKKLKSRLTTVVAAAVNRIGADVNLASVDVLKHIAGLSDKLARSIVRYRTERGHFTNRNQLRQVKGFDDHVFEQAAGFLRIENGTNPLDRTSIHPESYGIVEKMAQSVDLTVRELIESPHRVNSLDLGNFDQDQDRYTLDDIRSELLNPGRDPRRPFVPPQPKEGIRDLADLKEGMDLEGVVTNVTNFGAFVDLGVHQDGLIHISELSHRYVPDARRTIQIGDTVKVRVIRIDQEAKRISLSRKALLAKTAPRSLKPRAGTKGQTRSETRPPRKNPRSRPWTREAAVSLNTEASAPAEQLSMEEKIRRLQEKFKAPDR